MDNLPRINYRIKKKKFTYGSNVSGLVFSLSYMLIVSAFCIVLTAYFLLSACGKKGPPTLKPDDIASPPSKSQSVDSNNAETTPVKSSTEK